MQVFQPQHQRRPGGQRIERLGELPRHPLLATEGGDENSMLGFGLCIIKNHGDRATRGNVKRGRFVLEFGGNDLDFGGSEIGWG